MTVYLIHFETPYEHARHYLGFTTDLAARLAAHRAGSGARLMEVITQAGISWYVARTWEGGRNLERALKQRKNSPKLCPVCLQERFRARLGVQPLTLAFPPADLWQEDKHEAKEAFDSL